MSYENDYYAEVNKRMPKLGSKVKLADGREGTAIALNQIKESVRLKIEKGDEIEIVDVALSDIGQKSGVLTEELDAEKIDEELKDLLD